MGRRTSRAKGIGIAGLVALMVGGVLLGTAVAASATTPGSGETGCKNPACAITLNVTSGVAAGTSLNVNGNGFKNGSHGAVVECNLTPGEPTIAIPNNPQVKLANLGSLPVGCTTPSDDVVTVKGGGIGQPFGAQTGVIGPSAIGTDSANTSALTDAASYPCPPTQAQVAAGDSCAIVFQDAAGENAYVDITFTTPYTTTTTMAAPATTLVACNAQPNSASAKNGYTGVTATVTVTPATCLVGNDTVVVSATGLQDSSIGSILECNNDPGQPTVAFDSTTNIPVSCSKLNIFTTTPTGGVPTTTSKGEIPRTSSFWSRRPPRPSGARTPTRRTVAPGT